MPATTSLSTETRNAECECRMKKTGAHWPTVSRFLNSEFAFCVPSFCGRKPCLNRRDDEPILDEISGVARDGRVVVADEDVAVAAAVFQRHAVGDDAAVELHAAADPAVVPDGAVAHVALDDAALADRGADGAAARRLGHDAVAVDARAAGDVDLAAQRGVEEPRRRAHETARRAGVEPE